MKREKMVKWMKVALQRREMSKCVRAHYTTIAFDAYGNDLVTGVNGKPAGSKCDNECFRMGLLPDANAPKCCIHSEVNALLRGPFERYRGGTCLVTGTPCSDCMLLILQCGFAQLVGLEDDRPYTGYQDIEKHGIPIQVTILTKEEVGCV